MLRLIFLLSFFLISCQNSYIIKDTNLVKKIDQSGDFNLYPIYESHRGLVLFFWQASCPCVGRYQERMLELYEHYKNSSLAFLAITKEPQEYLSKNIAMPMLEDKEGRLAQALRVKGTPTAVLIDNWGDIRFMGWIDNERDRGERGREPYLENAIKEYLAQMPISKKTSPMFGCPF